MSTTVGDVVKDSHGMGMVNLRSPQGSTCCVYLHGAHVTSFRPVGHEEVLFLSRAAVFKPPKAIRGGIPVCWPQFNDMGSSGAHGFARNSLFSVIELRHDHVVLELAASPETREKFPYEWKLHVAVSVSDEHGGTLTEVIRIHNVGRTPLATTNALHAYLRVSDASRIEVSGLEGTPYLDNADSRVQKEGSPQPLTISGFVDRIYRDTRSEVRVQDPGLHREVVIRKLGFADAVVWNPWAEKARDFSDFEDNEYKEMVCVEPANAAGYVDGFVLEVAPGVEWRAECSLHVSAL